MGLAGQVLAGFGDGALADTFEGADPKVLAGSFIGQLRSNVGGQLFYGGVRVDHVAVVFRDHQLEMSLLGIVTEPVVGNFVDVVGAFQVFLGTQVDVFPAVCPELFPVTAASAILENVNIGTMSVGCVLSTSDAADDTPRLAL